MGWACGVQDVPVVMCLRGRSGGGERGVAGAPSTEEEGLAEVRGEHLNGGRGWAAAPGNGWQLPAGFWTIDANSRRFYILAWKPIACDGHRKRDGGRRGVMRWRLKTAGPESPDPLA